MDRGAFLQEVEFRLGARFPTLAEKCTAAVFKALHQRIEPGQSGHIASHLPKDLKQEWEGQPAGFRRMNKHEFLETVKQAGGFHNTDEAFQATAAVFGALKTVLPETDALNTAQELPEDLQEIWLEAA